MTAVVIIAGMYLGIEAGFTVGRLPHLLLILLRTGNVYSFPDVDMGFNRDYIRPYWGTVKKNKAVLIIYGVFAGVIFHF